MATDKVRYVTHEGKNVLVVDLSGSPGEAVSTPILATARGLIDAVPPKSLLLLTNVITTHYDAGSAEAMKLYSKQNNPYVKASAVVGAVGIKRILLNAVVKLTGRHIATFDTVEAGLDWLAAQ